ncbi:hypothetical protein D5S17_33815 [Pseudonocardiaceae bacterium YIM PH 21723]|nr:hypothetical protein D5S17_33815 [Pseudonocardiaceae bacterium YIM PH 21723]
MELGLSSETIYARCDQGGPWKRLQPGVILLSNSEPTREQRLAAALRYAGDGAVITGLDALCLQGLRQISLSGPPHLLVPASRQIRAIEATLVERTVRLPQPFIRLGFPTAPPHRAALDACRRFSTVDEVRGLLTRVIQAGKTTIADLSTELERGSNRRTRLARRVLNEIEDGIRSPAEAWARDLVLRSDLPAPSWNVPVHSPGGELLGVVDAWWDDVALAWEIDSVEFHFAERDYVHTVDRGSRLVAAGIFVVHTVPSTIRKEPRAVLARLTQAYHHAANRPRPPVVTR